MHSGYDKPPRPLAALSWLVEMGADEAIDPAPLDRLAAAPRETALFREIGAPPTAASAPPHQAPPVDFPLRRQPVEDSRARPAAPALIPRPSGEDPIAGARSMAAACQSLVEVAAALQGLEACPLQRTATSLCFLDGNREARVLFVGEAPGREEDVQGKPFVGRSGQLLDRMLAAIGLSRRAEDPARAALLTNVIFWRPPGNRKPTEAETLMCMPFVLRTLELVQPEFLVCLGGTPAQRILGATDGILRLRGRWRNYPLNGRETPLLPTLHPAYLLRNPAAKRLAWRDLLTLRKALDASAPS